MTKKVTLDREGKNVVLVGLEVEAERASRAYEVTCRDLSHHVEIPGFRKGKAPRNIIEKRFGKDAIKQEALDRLVPELLQEVITDENLDIITRPEIVECKFELGEPLKLSAKFEVRPEVTLGDYKGIAVDVPQAKLPDDALDTTLDNLASQKATMQAIDGREIVMGDHVLLDFEYFVDDKQVEEKATDVTLEMKEGALIDGFCEQLVGKKPGEQCEVEVTFPEEYRNDKLAGKPARFKVDVRELREKVVPDINDELAKQLDHESLDALKKSIEERMQEDVTQENDARAQKKVVDKVVENAKLDIPDSMIEREHELLMQQIRSFVEQNGQSWDDYQKMDEFKKLDQAKQDEASQRVLHSLVLGAVVREESMNVNEEELRPYIFEFAARNQVPEDKLAELYQDEYFIRQISEEVLTGKVVDFLVENATINWVEDTEHDHDDHDHDHGAESSEKPAKAEKKKKTTTKKSKTSKKAEDS